MIVAYRERGAEDYFLVNKLPKIEKKLSSSKVG